ncbi:hypothetical protein BDV98DRAFT_159717 [Pterulicium gracile]|uniref:Uncharacterized protein n=1 Tax=Pterulicium gracile TaxID=1884261 RepID=A0A5C3QXC1_9AGAR|nr:hypothetical protein BDV98DRAFT_159717 [Pterula gracilis]
MLAVWRLRAHIVPKRTIKQSQNCNTSLPSYHAITNSAHFHLSLFIVFLICIPLSLAINFQQFSSPCFSASTPSHTFPRIRIPHIGRRTFGTSVSAVSVETMLTASRYLLRHRSLPRLACACRGSPLLGVCSLHPLVYHSTALLPDPVQSDTLPTRVKADSPQRTTPQSTLPLHPTWSLINTLKLALLPLPFVLVVSFYSFLQGLHLPPRLLSRILPLSLSPRIPFLSPLSHKLHLLIFYLAFSIHPLIPRSLVFFPSSYFCCCLSCASCELHPSAVPFACCASHACINLFYPRTFSKW